MKKFLLAGFVVVAFIVYSIHQRSPDSTTAVVRPPSSLSSGSTSPSSSPTSGSSAGSSQPAITYKDGQYTGSAANAFYGYIQVKAIIQGGKISDVQFLQYPNDQSNSVAINTQAMPFLKQEAIQAQSAQVDVVSGATDSSQAFVQSLSSALAQAK